MIVELCWDVDSVVGGVLWLGRNDVKVCLYLCGDVGSFGDFF